MTAALEEEQATIETPLSEQAAGKAQSSFTPLFELITSSLQGDVGSFEERYSERESIARGGMGAVVSMWDNRIGREVAVKFMRTENAGRADHRARFVREACLQGRLEHPSIVPVHDVGVAPNGELYFTMKRVKGMTLKEILGRLRAGDAELASRFTRRRLLAAFGNVCLTIAFAHDRGVVHRDLKPSNIMLGDFGEAYVLDFGLAKYIGDPEPNVAEPSEENVVDTRTGFVFGTPGFMPPEQLAGATRAVGPLVDVFALGAILFEILALEPLYPVNQSRAAIMRATLQGVESRFSVRCPHRDVPPELESICVKATAYDVEDRYKTVRELHDVIERFLDGDRDLSLRGGMAALYAQSAETELGRAMTGDNQEEALHRSQAMREVGRALALEPNNEQATRTLGRLLLEPPRTMPAEAVLRLEATKNRYETRFELRAALTYAILFMLVPLTGVWGVRDWGFLVETGGALAMLAMMSWLSSRLEQRPRWLCYGRLVLGFATIGFVESQLGLFMMASLVLFLVVTTALRPDRGLRIVATFMGAAMLCGFALLEHAGVAMAPRGVEGTRMWIAPLAGNLDPTAMLVGLAFVSALIVVVAGTYVGAAREELSDAERRIHLSNWLLSQLVPAESLSLGQSSADG